MSEVTLLSDLKKFFADECESITYAFGEITLEVTPSKLIAVMTALRDEAPFQFEMLLDVAGVDYLHYGLSEWATESSTSTGFERAVRKGEMVRELSWDKPRFGVTYHLLSLSHNQRVRVKTYVAENDMVVPSVTPIWESANWFEREAFDLFGILFESHPDLRRILTDYGFIGHPFRKDFPLSGHVEVRYDAKLGRVIYEPVDIDPRVLGPKVIRLDNRYAAPHGEKPHG